MANEYTKVRNPSGAPVPISGLDVLVPPGATVSIPSGYCTQRRNPNGSLREPIIKDLAPQLEILESVAATDPDNPPGVPTVADLQAEGHSEGVAQVLHANAVADARAKGKPKG